MIVKFFCPRWGSEQIPWPVFLENVKAAGYAGVEWFPYGEPTDPATVVNLLKQYDLEFSIVMAVIPMPDNFKEYLTAFKEQLTALSQLQPLFISAQTGREYYTEEQIIQCLEVCDQISVPVYQETHRNKWTFAAHAVGPLLRKFPSLPLTLDVSHWFCVSESYLEDQQDTVAEAIRHARHVHARVGHTEGPQVWDPALPEYEAALAAHLAIWDEWIKQRKKNGDQYCTITPEFGPPPYMVMGDRKGSPQQEQWRINLWMKIFLDNRYNQD
ncbi:sugar phosphate isomerase/epimerase [Chitinophaga sp. SYP-B3965]|uniref:sugar phosphate isomerase/epimerase family protein n=1 Tax=Chitinophaga sp. SYP-B3965 TaxID=2663120 RepID=UPI001299F520|nr:sugar phosphate isomerase/epimerase [Chitinophaga sp. SYP-B3965]MRG45016.1 sugar phosphate isomerase/epimerase [Chitinophaga sp. SYP-B3965]